ncbi:hypothetical protein DFR67_12379 [Williamsia limnetica]|uniref:Hydroxyneurosporene synthase CrtC n=1 Tax=Williamsia limnetica TaxID=882452 RepID=A0A318RTD4_WILLI|nr:hypothetical protein [Williamsia limnetica]PYE12354.1 hypothetical protein DFR67_12379 [Williamsia limnetica]
MPHTESRYDSAFHDELTRPGAAGLPDRFFDRFVFNLHPTDATSPSVIFGFGMYPAKDTVDGFVVVSDETEQRNLRYSTLLSTTDGSGGGPFSFNVASPNRTWQLRLGPNPGNVEFDLTWEARTPAWFGEVSVDNAGADSTAFDHLFQSGRYTGTLTIDGVTRSVDGWYGQRDRSRGVRTMAGGQGLHIWYQAQFADLSIGFLLVETRDHNRLLLEGAVMHVDGRLDPIVDVGHDLEFDESRDLRRGKVKVVTASGVEYVVGADASAGGGHMAGAGYGGHHGAQLGADHVEFDSYPLDGSVNPATLDSALTDRLCTFDLNGHRGSGIFEFALTRSRSYSYLPTM